MRGARPPKYHFGFGRVDPVFGLVPANPPPAPSPPPLAREVQRQQEEEKRRQLLVQQQERSQHAHRMRELEHQAELRRAANRQDATDIARWQREQRAGTSKRLLAEMVGAPGGPAADGGGGGAAKRSRQAALNDQLAQLERETRAAASAREAQEEHAAREAEEAAAARLTAMLAAAKNMQYQKDLDKLLTEEQRKKKEAEEARRRAEEARLRKEQEDAEAARRAKALADAEAARRGQVAADQAAEAARRAQEVAAAAAAAAAAALPPAVVPPAARAPGEPVQPEYLGGVGQRVEASKDDVARKDRYTGRAAAPAQKAMGVTIVKAAKDFARIGTIPGPPTQPPQRVPRVEDLGTVTYARIAMGNIPPWLGTLDAETQKFALERILHKVVLPTNEVDEEQYMERPICITHGSVVVNLERTLIGQGVKQQALRKLNVFCIATDPKHPVPPHQYWQLWQAEVWPRLKTLPSVGHAYGHTVPRGPPRCGIWAKEKKPREGGPDAGKDYEEWKYHTYARVGVMAAILTYPNDEGQWQRPTALFDAPAAWAWVAAVVNNLRELQTKSEQGGGETIEVAYDYDFWMGALRVFLKVGGYYMHCMFAGQFDKVLRVVEKLLTRKVQQYRGRVSHQTPLNDALGVYKQHLTSLDANHFPVKISAVHVAEFILEQRSLNWPLPAMVRKFFTGQ